MSRWRNDSSIMEHNVPHEDHLGNDILSAPWLNLQLNPYKTKVLLLKHWKFVREIKYKF
jgi:hypothetical protein